MNFCRFATPMVKAPDEGESAIFNDTFFSSAFSVSMNAKPPVTSWPNTTSFSFLISIPELNRFLVTIWKWRRIWLMFWPFWLTLWLQIYWHQAEDCWIFLQSSQPLQVTEHWECQLYLNTRLLDSWRYQLWWFFLCFDTYTFFVLQQLRIPANLPIYFSLIHLDLFISQKPIELG